MRGFERQTHASWHRVNDNNDQDDNTAQCPWCRHEPRAETPRPQSSAYSKRPTKRPETTSTNRTDVISPAPARPAKHSVKQFDQKAEFGSHADADLNPGTADDTEASPETASQRTKYMGRTVTGSNGAFTTETSRPRLPDAWTQDSEEPDTGTRDGDVMAQDSRSELHTSGDFKEGDEEKAGSLEPDVEE